MLVELNEIEELNIDEGKVGIIFYIPGHCAGCKRAIGILETKKLDDWTVYKVNSESDKFSRLIKQYEVSTAPTIVIFENGKQKDKIVGLKSFIEKKDIFGE